MEYEFISSPTLSSAKSYAFAIFSLNGPDSKWEIEFNNTLGELEIPERAQVALRLSHVKNVAFPEIDIQHFNQTTVEELKQIYGFPNKMRNELECNLRSRHSRNSSLVTETRTHQGG